VRLCDRPTVPCIKRIWCCVKVSQSLSSSVVVRWTTRQSLASTQWALVSWISNAHWSGCEPRSGSDSGRSHQFDRCRPLPSLSEPYLPVRFQLAQGQDDLADGNRQAGSRQRACLSFCPCSLCCLCVPRCHIRRKRRSRQCPSHPGSRLAASHFGPRADADYDVPPEEVGY
jgi:hypothetical protein